MYDIETRGDANEYPYRTSTSARFYLSDAVFSHVNTVAAQSAVSQLM